MNRKLDFVVKELRRLRISIAGIQETKWFGKDIWNADGYTLIHSGRPLPNEDEPQRRNEGVGILLDERATQAWKDAGENWKAVSSRVVVARLKVVHRSQRRPGGSRETSNTYLSIVSTYAPTAKAPPGIKTKFVDELQDTLDSVPHDDILTLLGDFNARVGKCEFEEDIWRQVRGRHGIGICNEAGEKLLELCAVNSLTIMNTWFQKKQVHLATWKHPATKQAHMIDFVMMRRGQRQLCSYVRVHRSACCWSGHHLVKGKVRLQLPRRKRIEQTYIPLAVHTLSSRSRGKKFQESMSQSLLQCPHKEYGSIEENRERLKLCIIETAEQCVGREWKKQPDWFYDAIDTLMPLVHAKQKAYCCFLKANTTAVKKEFRRYQRTVKKAVDEAMEAWINVMSMDAVCASKNEKRQWESIRKLQLAHAGRRPARPTKLCKMDGSLTSGPEEVKLAWHEHFSRVLNITSQYQQAVLDQIPSRPSALELDHSPTFDELLEALRRLKRRKAGGRTGILPELLLYGGTELHDRLTVLMENIWKGGTVVKDWKDAEIAPIPKKEDLTK